MLRQLLPVMFGLGLCSVLHAADLKPEERLQAIRQAMVDAAMNSHTLVSATSWMDSQGALRELNRFSSEIKLRDLQVAEYSRDSQNQPRATLVKTQLDRVEPSACRAPKSKAPLRHVMSLGMDVSPEFIQSQRYEAQQVGRFARAKLLQSAPQAQHLRLMTNPLQVRAYDRAMHGQGEELVSWHLQLTVVPANYYTTEGKAGYVLRWMAKSSTGQAPVQGEALLGITPPKHAVGTPKMDDDLMRSIHAQVDKMIRNIDQAFACEPPTLAVMTNQNGQFTLQAGEMAGLRVGDQVLLSDPRVLPQHALEVGALDGAVLAEVKSVSAYQSELKQVAGKALKNQDAWVAWPFTY
ncbi:MAG: hypothetical protein ACOVNN_11410 [Limnohabitans sp.]